MASSPCFDPAEMPANSLITPPHHIIDSFSKSSLHHAASAAGSDRGSSKSSVPPTPPSLMSPPVSPNFQHVSSEHHHVLEAGEEPAASSPQSVQDPVLFPAEEAYSPSSQVHNPLFSHANHRAGAFKSATPRKQLTEVSGPFHTFTIQMMPAYIRDRKLWRQRELSWLKENDLRRRFARLERQGGLKARDATTSRVKGKASPKTSKPEKSIETRPIPSLAPKPPANERPVRNRRATAAAIAAAAAASLAVLANNGAPPSRLVAPEPEPIRKRTVAPKSEDKDVKNFAALPDYCPPLDSLQGQGKCLKVDWKSNPIDLANDVHRQLLHPDEITLASSLRLDCAHYLAVKRRFFVDRLKCMRDGKQFRKTDAQKACGIDVNKASQLWTAYDRVGWLKPQWMEAYL